MLETPSWGFHAIHDSALPSAGPGRGCRVNKIPVDCLSPQITRRAGDADWAASLSAAASKPTFAFAPLGMSLQIQGGGRAFPPPP
eukprot:9123436-Pyramimonas_sp.AAC.1